VASSLIETSFQNQEMFLVYWLRRWPLQKKAIVLDESTSFGVLTTAHDQALNAENALALTVIGLVLNLIATVLLGFWPPRGRVYTKDGAQVVTWANDPSQEGKRIGVRQERLAALGPWFLGAGFFLQLIASFG
jgi:hypothetical protein